MSGSNTSGGSGGKRTTPPSGERRSQTNRSSAPPDNRRGGAPAGPNASAVNINYRPSGFTPINAPATEYPYGRPGAPYAMTHGGWRAGAEGSPQSFANPLTLETRNLSGTGPASPRFSPQAPNPSPLSNPNSMVKAQRALGLESLKPVSDAEKKPYWAYNLDETNVSSKDLLVVPNLPEQVMPRPDLRRHICRECIRRWGLDALPASSSCSCASPSDKCGNCKSSKSNPKCDAGYPAEFNRTLNMVEWYRQRAIRDDGADPFRVATRQSEFRAYCKSFTTRLRAVVEEVENDYDNSISKWRAARRASFEKNSRSFKDRMGISGSMEPSNIVSNREMELGAVRSMTNQEKRLAYYGRAAM
ncbi:hypothetical protein LTR09_012335 [Extremus antarcticus]|uniref:Uncharacterized protein n=1 Tax=Extremus antarcticus TaxID=702011 RepID=A0AAJ0D523_9PEZI|nr:hypothetical protein LTR09_012335 [Extremus antarcticus]